MIMEMSAEIGEIAKALPKAQSAMGEVFKTATNPAFRSKYANLSAVIEAVVPALNSNGITLLQPSAFDGELMHVATMLLHDSGQWVRCTMSAPLTKRDAQGIGSATTYLRRYGLQAMAGVAPEEDDDGNAASQGKPTPPVKKDYGPAPMGDDWQGAEGHGPSSYSAKKNGGDARFKEILAEIHSLGTMVEVGMFTKTRTDEIRGLPEGWRKVLREKLDEQRHLIAAENNFRTDEAGGSGDEGVAGDSGRLEAAE